MNNNMWRLILSGLRIFIFAPIVFIMAVVGILICITEDLILVVLKLLLEKVKGKKLMSQNGVILIKGTNER